MNRPKSSKRPSSASRSVCVKPAAVQVDCFGISKMRDTLGSIQQQLSQCDAPGQPEHDGSSLRSAELSEAEVTLERLGLGCTSMVDITVQLEKAIKSNEAELARLEHEYADLTETKANLALEHRKMFANFSLHEIGRKVSQGHMATTNNDLVREVRLRDYAEEEVAKKTDTLNSWRDKVTSDRKELNNEWSAFAADVARYSEEKRPYYQEIDETNNIVISQMRNMLNGGADTDSDGADYDPEVFESTIQFLESEKELRALKENYIERQMEFRKNESELGYLNGKRGTMWRYCLGLERLLQPEGVGRQEGFLLRPSEARFEIAFTDGAGPNTVTSEEDIRATAESDTRRKLLHRCSKHTNLYIEGVTEEETTPEISTATAERAARDEAADDDEEGEADEDGDEQENELQTQSFLKNQTDKLTSHSADRPPETAGPGAGSSSPRDAEGEEYQMMSKLRKRLGVQSTSQQRYGHLRSLESAGRAGSSTNILPFGGANKKSRR